jgi:transposase
MRWLHEIVAWHRAKVTSGTTESTSNLIRRVKRVSFWLGPFRYYRIGALLYAGKPNWSVLETAARR